MDMAERPAQIVEIDERAASQFDRAVFRDDV